MAINDNFLVMADDGKLHLVLDHQLNASGIDILDAAGYYAAIEAESALAEIGQELGVHNLTGFENRDDSTISWDNATYTFTLTPDSTDYYWVAGVRYSYNSAQTEQIDNTTSGIHVIYFDDGAPQTLTSIANPTHTQMDDIIINCCIVGLVYWNATDADTSILADERHGCIMSGRTHEWLHDNMGAKYREGGGLSGYTLNTSSDAAIGFDLTDVEFYDEDIEHEIEDGTYTNQYEQALSDGGGTGLVLPVLYRDDVDGSWTQTAAANVPYLVSGTPQPQYMNDDGDGTWSLQELGNAKFMLYWMVVTNDWEYPVKLIPGSAEYNTQAGAQQGAATEIVDWGNMPSAEFIIIYQFIMQQSAGSTPELKIIDVIDYRFTELTGASYTPTDHGSLSGLGDQQDHDWAYTLDGSRSITGDLIFAGGALIKTDDVDGSDDNVLRFCGGGDSGDDRGAELRVYGNEQGSYPGCFRAWVGAGVSAWYDFPSATQIVLNDSGVNAFMTVGLTINQGAADSEILAFKSSDVAHGVTVLNETDTFAAFYKNAGAAGGLRIRAIRDPDGSNRAALSLQAILCENVDTTMSSAGRAISESANYQNDGTDFGDVVADGNIFAIRGRVSGSSIAQWICDIDGDTWQSGGITTEDDININTNSYPALYLRQADATLLSVVYHDTSNDLLTLNHDGSAVEGLCLAADSLVFIKDSANAGMTAGLTINQASADNEILAFKSSDIAHGVTDYTETDTWCYFKKYAGASGGLHLVAFDDTGGVGMFFQAILAANPSQAPSTSAQGAFHFRAELASGTGTGTLGASAIIASFADRGTTYYTIDEDGGSWQYGHSYYRNIKGLEMRNFADNAYVSAIVVTVDDILQIGDGNAASVNFAPAGNVYIADSANTNMTKGMTINQGANDDHIFDFKSSDVAHGITTLAETDTFGWFKKLSSTAGGVRLFGASEDIYGVDIYGYCTNDNTTKGSTSNAPIRLNSAKKSGTSVAAMGADANLVCIQENGATRWQVDEDGDTWQQGNVYTDKNVILSTNNEEIFGRNAADDDNLRIVKIDTNDALLFAENAVAYVQFVTGPVFIDDNANSLSTGGLTINQLSYDDECLSLKSSDIGHGHASWTETDTFAVLKKRRGGSGGLRLSAYAENAAYDQTLVLEAWGGTATTVKTTAAIGLIDFWASEIDGADGMDNIAANGNVLTFRVRRGGVSPCILLLDEDGDLYIDGALSKIGGTGAPTTADHGTATDPEVVSVVYGTGSPPVANTTPIGTLWIKYTA